MRNRRLRVPPLRHAPRPKRDKSRGVAMKKLFALLALLAFSLSLPAGAAGHKKHRRSKRQHHQEHIHHTAPFGTYPASYIGN